MNKKTKRKGHSPIKRQSLLMRAIGKSTLVAWSRGQENNQAFSLTGKRKPVSRKTHEGFATTPLPWSTCCVICCRDQQGEEYIQSVFIKATGSHPFSAVAETFDKYHQKMIKEANPLHVLSAGWVASPIGSEIDEKLALSILEQLNCWDFRTEWQITQDMEKAA